MSTPNEQRLRKYAIGRTLQTSDTHAWSSVLADHLQYPSGVAPPFELSVTEVCIATRRDDTLITRRAGGLTQSCRSKLGLAWLCPAGVSEEEVVIHGPIELLHVYLPASRFDQLSDVCGGSPVAATAVGYLDDIQDPLIQQIGAQILGELTCQSAGGQVLVDALSLALTARLVQSYAATEGRRSTPIVIHHGLGEVRLARVLEYIRAHIEENLGIDELASVACLSPFHFARMFRASMGIPPHRYLCALRIERAKHLLARTTTPLAEIALTACFSTQANFTRAFRTATGVTPGEFRRQAR